MPWSLMYCIASVGLQWKRGGSPSTISMTMIPSDQMSTWRGGGGREGEGEGGKERGREGRREGGREGGKEGGREGEKVCVREAPENHLTYPTLQIHVHVHIE